MAHGPQRISATVSAVYRGRSGCGRLGMRNGSGASRGDLRPRVWSVGGQGYADAGDRCQFPVRCIPFRSILIISRILELTSKCDRSMPDGEYDAAADLVG
jgi:hypothetical protein